ncbi:hypothetical protein ACK56M_17925 [Pseudomonas sp. s4]|uniref:hypothetical protein n=1 Tax=Pseudomonas sp. s4 TaxID=353218 RepID=UPI00398CF584
MKITIKQRDTSNMSHETADQVGDIWDVYQGDVLVGVYHSESDALKYKKLLESKLLETLSPPRN